MSHGYPHHRGASTPAGGHHGPHPYTYNPVSAHPSALGAAGAHAVHAPYGAHPAAVPPYAPGYAETYARFPTHSPHYGAGLPAAPWGAPFAQPPPPYPLYGPPPPPPSEPDPKLEAVRRRRQMLRQQRQRALAAAQSMMVQAAQARQFQQAAAQHRSSGPTDVAATLAQMQQQQQQIQSVLTSLVTGAPVAAPAAAGTRPALGSAQFPAADALAPAARAKASTRQLGPGGAKADAGDGGASGPEPGPAAPAPAPPVAAGSSAAAAGSSQPAARPRPERAAAAVVRQELGAEEVEGLRGGALDRLLAEDALLTRDLDAEGEGGAGAEYDSDGSEGGGAGGGEGGSGGSEARARHRATIEQRLRLSRMQAQDRKPRWRFEAAGEATPAREQLLGGRALLRACALALVFCGTLRRSVRRKHLRMRWTELQDMHKLLVDFFDYTRTWLARVVRVPVASILTDKSLDFETRADVIAAHRSFNPFKRGESVDKRALKLRVRVKGLLDELSHAVQAPKAAPPQLLKFLRKLTANGTFLPADFLWSSEVAALGFTDLGALKGMEMPLDDPPARASGGADESGGAYAFGEIALTRREALLANFVIGRILVPHVLLRPWQQVGLKPKRRTVHNCRIFATLIFRLLRRCVRGEPPGRKAPASGDANPFATKASDATAGPQSAGMPAGGSMFAGGIAEGEAAGPQDPLEAPLRHSPAGPPFVEGTRVPLPRPLRPIGESAAEYYARFGMPPKYAKQQGGPAALRHDAARDEGDGAAAPPAPKPEGGDGAALAARRGGIAGSVLGRVRRRRASSTGGGSDDAGGAGGRGDAGGDGGGEDAGHGGRSAKLRAAASAMRVARKGGSMLHAAGGAPVQGPDGGAHRGAELDAAHDEEEEEEEEEEEDDVFSQVSGGGGGRGGGDGGDEGTAKGGRGVGFASAASTRVIAGRAAAQARELAPSGGPEVEEGERARIAPRASAARRDEEDREFVELDSIFMTEDEVCGLLLGDAEELGVEEEMGRRFLDIIVDLSDLVMNVES